MPRKVAVVGAGVVGLLCAYHLRRRGAEVVLLDRGTPGAGCSAGNVGWICPSIATPVPTPALLTMGLAWFLRSDSPLYVRPTAIPRLAPWLWRFWRACSPEAHERAATALTSLAAGAPALYRELRAEGIEFELHEDGLVLAYGQDEAMAEELEALRGSGHEAIRELTRDELLRMEPALGFGARAPLVGGIHIASESYVRPESLCAGVSATCATLGVEVRTDFPVQGFGREPGRGRLQARSLLGPEGEIEADAFVIATGAEAGALAGRCGTRLPMQAGKGYSVTVREPRLSIRHAIYFAEDKVGVTPYLADHRVAGTMELSGINTRLDSRRLANVRRSAEKVLPGVLDGAEQTEWVGMRPMTPDGLPVMGRLPSTRNVYVASGHQMLGMTLAPASGKAMAELILGPDPGPAKGADLMPFDPGRFRASGA